MDLGFASEGLAALCNAERLMVERWGPEIGRTVGSRLLDLAAATVGTIERIPDAAIELAEAGVVTIVFENAIVIRGVVTPSGGDMDGNALEADQLVISSIDVQEGEA